MLAKSKVISLEKFNNWLFKNKEYIVLGSTDGKAGFNLRHNHANKPYECGCGVTHKFIPNYTRIFWRRVITDARMIVQDPSCTFICYLEMKGIFIIKFETLYSANKYTGNKELDEKNSWNFSSLILTKK